MLLLPVPAVFYPVKYGLDIFIATVLREPAECLQSRFRQVPLPLGIGLGTVNRRDTHFNSLYTGNAFFSE